MGRVGTAPGSLKHVGGWLAEKMSRIKLGSSASGPSDFLAIETLSLGVEGKACLWRALKDVAPRHPGLVDFDFDHLIERAEHQRSELERERLRSPHLIRAPAFGPGPQSIRLAQSRRRDPRHS